MKTAFILMFLIGLLFGVIIMITLLVEGSTFPKDWKWETKFGVGFGAIVGFALFCGCMGLSRPLVYRYKRAAFEKSGMTHEAADAAARGGFRLF